VITANHFLLDAVLGLLTAGVAAIVAAGSRGSARRSGRLPRTATGERGDLVSTPQTTDRPPKRERRPLTPLSASQTRALCATG
jgi:hypothetical protein